MPARVTEYRSEQLWDKRIENITDADAYVDRRLQDAAGRFLETFFTFAAKVADDLTIGAVGGRMADGSADTSVFFIEEKRNAEAQADH